MATLDSSIPPFSWHLMGLGPTGDLPAHSSFLLCAASKIRPSLPSSDIDAPPFAAIISFFPNSSSVFQERRRGFDLLLSLAPGCGCVPSCPSRPLFPPLLLFTSDPLWPPSHFYSKCFLHHLFLLLPAQVPSFTPHALLILPWKYSFLLYMRITVIWLFSG